MTSFSDLGLGKGPASLHDSPGGQDHDDDRDAEHDDDSHDDDDQDDDPDDVC